MLELLLANWVVLAVFHFCTHELPMIVGAGYLIYRKWFKVKPVNVNCDHECEPREKFVDAGADVCEDCGDTRDEHDDNWKAGMRDHVFRWDGDECDSASPREKVYAPGDNPMLAGNRIQDPEINQAHEDARLDVLIKWDKAVALAKEAAKLRLTVNYCIATGCRKETHSGFQFCDDCDGVEGWNEHWRKD